MACTPRSSESKRAYSGVFLCFHVLCFVYGILCRIPLIWFYSELDSCRAFWFELHQYPRLCLRFPSLLSLCSHFQHRNPPCLTKALFLFITRAISQVPLMHTGLLSHIDCTFRSSSLHAVSVLRIHCRLLQVLSYARTSLPYIPLSLHLSIPPHPQMFTAGLAAPRLPVAPGPGVSARRDDSV